VRKLKKWLKFCILRVIDVLLALLMEKGTKKGEKEF